MRLTVGTKANRGIVGRLLISLFFLLFFALGAFFTVLMAQQAWQNLRQLNWKSTPCEILESQVERPVEQDDDPAFRVQYRYQYSGRTYVGDRISVDSTRKEDDDAYRLVQGRYAARARTTCYVNPDDPSQAVLERGNPWVALAVFFPLIFVAVGVVGLIAIWTPSKAAEARPLSDRAQSKNSAGCLVLFFGVFLAAGLAVFYGFFLRPMMQIQEAKTWQATPCRIVSSRVKSHRGDDSTTYSVDVIYRYTFRGKEYENNRYSFLRGSSSGHSGKAAIVRQLPEGKIVTGFVNPENPTDSVLQRGYTSELWFGLIPLVFVLVGIGGIVFALRKGGSHPPPAGGTERLFRQPYSPAGYAEPSLTLSGPMELKPRNTRIGKLLGMILLALFWNGIVSVFLFHCISDWQRGAAPWFLTLFLIPFVTVGLGLIGGVVYTLLGVFNPVPRVRVSDVAIPLGGTFEVTWAFEGRVHVLKNLKITLEGSEHATYRRGTDTRTDTEIFATFKLMDSMEGGTVQQGSAKVIVPAGTMHSFVSQNNAIRWTLRFKGEIARWPDLNEEYALTVLPLPATP